MSDLFKQSINRDSRGLKSYAIDSFVYIAFFGGFIPLTIFSVINALWLRVEKNRVHFILFLGIVCFLAKMFITYNIVKTHSIFGFEFTKTNFRYVRWGFNGFAVILFYFNKLLLNEDYKVFQLSGKEHEPLLGKALIAIVGWGAISFFIRLYFIKMVG